MRRGHVLLDREVGEVGADRRGAYVPGMRVPPWKSMKRRITGR